MQGECSKTTALIERIKMREPNLNTLKMFDAAARHLNFRLAAEELNLTQGAVAQQVRRLEADLENQLFLRKARGLELTITGRNYHNSISQALAIINEATANLQPESSSITISTPPSFASKWLVPRLSSFLNMHPNIEVQTIANSGLANFKSDGVDLAIRQGKMPLSDELNVELLSPLILSAICSHDYAKKLPSALKLEDLATHQLIHDAHKNWLNLLDGAGIKPKQRIIQFNQTALAMDAASNGQGITLAPRILLNAATDSNRLVTIWEDDRNEQGGYYIVYPKKQKPSSARDVLIAWLLSEIKDDDHEHHSL
jgi:LysR family glycine cleavage system transcriptional activator